MKKLLLWLTLLWAIAALAVSLLVLASGADLEGIQARQEIVKLLQSAPEGPRAAELSYFANLLRSLNHLSIWHAVTAVLLIVASISGLRTGRGRDVK